MRPHGANNSNNCFAYPQFNLMVNFNVIEMFSVMRHVPSLLFCMPESRSINHHHAHSSHSINTCHGSFLCKHIRRIRFESSQHSHPWIKLWLKMLQWTVVHFETSRCLCWLFFFWTEDGLTVDVVVVVLMKCQGLQICKINGYRFGIL